MWHYLTGRIFFQTHSTGIKLKTVKQIPSKISPYQAKIVKLNHSNIFTFYLNICVVKVNFNNCAAEGFMANSGTSSWSWTALCSPEAKRDLGLLPLAGELRCVSYNCWWGYIRCPGNNDVHWPDTSDHAWGPYFSGYSHGELLGWEYFFSSRFCVNTWTIIVELNMLQWQWPGVIWINVYILYLYRQQT